jgi:heme-degrading monooxygenase HmoA
VRYTVDPDRCTEALQALEEAAKEIGDIDGISGGYVLEDGESGRLITVTLWRDRAALDASEVRATRLRQEALRPVEGEIDSVERLNVASEIGDTRSSPA